MFLIELPWRWRNWKYAARIAWLVDVDHCLCGCRRITADVCFFNARDYLGIPMGTLGRGLEPPSAS